MENKLERGPYESKKAAMKANAVIDMKGGFVSGRLIRVKGEVMRVLSCRASQMDGTWYADVTTRPANEEELRQVQIAELERELNDALNLIAHEGGWQNPSAAAHAGKANDLKARIAALKA